MINERWRWILLILCTVLLNGCATSTKPANQSERETIQIMILGHGVENPGVFTVPSGLIVSDLFELDPAGFREDASPVVRLERRDEGRILILEIDRDTGKGLNSEVLPGDRILTSQGHFER